MTQWHFERFNQQGLFKAVTRDGRTMRRIALDAGITPKYMYQLMKPLSGKKFIRPDTVDKLAKALDVDREELIL